jgi:hypothetical protein
MAVSSGSTVPSLKKYATISNKMKLKINHSHYIGRRHYEASNKNWNVKPN